MSWEREPLGIRASLRHGARKYKLTWLRHVTFEIEYDDEWSWWSANMDVVAYMNGRRMDSVIVRGKSWYTWGSDRWRNEGAR